MSIGIKYLKSRRLLVLAMALALWAIETPAAFAQELTAAVDKATVATDEHFQLEFTFTGGGVSGGKNFKMPDMSRFLILSGPSQSTSMQIINGSVSSSVTYSYVLQPRDPGKFVIGTATIEAGGKQYSSQPLTITVVKGSGKSAPSAGAQQQADAQVQVGDNLFLRAVVDRSRVFVGEQITVQYKIYTRVRIGNYSLNKLPAMTGFWGEELAMPQQVNLANETINGKQYQVGTLKKTALFPTQSGTLQITPMDITCQVQVQAQNRRRSNDWFDQFFNDPFGAGGSMQSVSVKSPAVTITVLPLPKTDVPASFKGAVGRFGLQVSLSKNRVKTNEPVTLKAVISGSGNVKILEAPALELPGDFEKYDPKVNESIERNGVINGSKTFEWLIVPRYPGAKKIPALEFSYYDPARGKYTTVRSNPIDVTVEKGSAESVPAASGISKEDVKLLSQDIRFIKTGNSSFRPRDEEYLSSGTLLALAGVPLLGFIGLLIYRQSSVKARADVVSFRSRRAMKIATKRLKQAKILLARNDAQVFYAEIARALWAYLADKLAIDTASLSIDSVFDELTRRAVPVPLAVQIREALEACEFARFAPASSSPEEKSKMYSAANDVIVAAEKELH
ncbi:MAG: BatD family protein [Ignavibacteriales bacterium]|nr:BatD family protein [Ignavibacteriales bacterium]